MAGGEGSGADGSGRAGQGDHPGDPRGDLRRALGSWLQGPRAAGVDLGYPGERLGLPPRGPGSVAGFGWRLAAFGVDTVMVNLVARGLLRDEAWILPVFALEVFLLTALIGASVGQRLCRLRVARVDGRPVGFARAFLRTVLLCLLVPALIWDRDGRGLHDRAAGTVVVHVRSVW